MWLAASFYDQFGGRVCLAVHEFNHGAPSGRHEIYLTLEQPPLRQGEYVGTFELLPGSISTGKVRAGYRICLFGTVAYFLKSMKDIGG